MAISLESADPQQTGPVVHRTQLFFHSKGYRKTWSKLLICVGIAMSMLAMSGIITYDILQVSEQTSLIQMDAVASASLSMGCVLLFASFATDKYMLLVQFQMPDSPERTWRLQMIHHYTRWTWPVTQALLTLGGIGLAIVLSLA